MPKKEAREETTTLCQPAAMLFTPIHPRRQTRTHSMTRDWGFRTPRMASNTSSASSTIRWAPDTSTSHQRTRPTDNIWVLNSTMFHIRSLRTQATQISSLPHVHGSRPERPAGLARRTIAGMKAHLASTIRRHRRRLSRGHLRMAKCLMAIRTSETWPHTGWAVGSR